MSYVKLYILLVFSFLFFIQKDPAFNKQGKPSTSGIISYVENNKIKFIKEFETFVKDTFFLDIEISSDNLSNYSEYSSLDMAYHYTYRNGTDEIVIDNKERYVAYDINELSKLKKVNLKVSNAFVKTVIMHELGHSYFLQIIQECIFNNIYIHEAYDFRKQLTLYPNSEQSYGAEFIEEGVCQYIVNEMKLDLSINPYVPIVVEDIMSKNNNELIKYNYSVEYLKEFLDFFGLKKGIAILITNSPPTYLEILNSDLFFDRLK